MENNVIYVLYDEIDLGNGKSTGHWKLKFNGTTVSDMPTKESAITRAIAQQSGLNADKIILIDPETKEEEEI